MPSVLRDAIRARPRDLAVGTALLTLHQACEALVPVMAGVVIDEAVGTGDAGALVWTMALLAVLFVVLSNAFRFGYRRSMLAAEHAEHELRMRIVARVFGGAASRPAGELVSLATSDAGRVAAVVIVIGFGGGVLSAVLVAGGVLLTISLPLGLIVLVGLPPVLAAVQLAARPLARRASAEQEQAAGTAALATDLVTGLRVLKGIRAERAAVDRYTAASGAALKATLRAARADAALNGITTLVVGAFLALVAGIGGKLALDGEMSVGALVAAVGLTQFLVGPLTRVAWVAGELARARASAARVAELLADDGPPPPAPEGPEIAVAAGRLTGVVATDGVLVIDGAPLEGLVVPHDADLFSGTVASNAGTDAAALRAAAADELGLDTDVGERGSALSGGQRQRVALARALAARAPVLVLDEPTTAVDAATEARIADGIRDLRRGSTTVLLTTSPALLAVTDEVVFGSERGAHADLLRRDPAYAELVLG